VESRQPDDNATSRAIVPTRPTLLGAKEHLRILIVIPGPMKVVHVTLFTRSKEAQAWSPSPMKLDQRRTYTGELSWREAPGLLMDYFVTAQVEMGGTRKTLASPPEAPHRYYTLTLL
jgi:hypothetical protein